MKALMVGALAAAICALLLGGCGGREASGEPIPAPDYKKIVSRLQDWGLKLAEIGELRVPCYSVDPKTLLVGSGTLQVYEYPDLPSATVAIGRILPVYFAAQVAATGLTEEASSLHFYRGDRLLVIYRGTDARVVEVLDGALGPAFADGASGTGCLGGT